MNTVCTTWVLTFPTPPVTSKAMTNICPWKKAAIWSLCHTHTTSVYCYPSHAHLKLNQNLCRFSSNTTYLRLHYPKLQQFASYLIKFSLTPGNQLSTDDFAGQLVNQTNLAIKGIVGLAAMAEIASLTDHAEDAAKYSSTATSFYKQWETLAIAPEGTHTLLAYQWRSSYSLLYNIYPALLLNLSIIPDSLYEMQSSFYPSVSQIFGVPLDNRHSYTKSDESLWTAATCSPQTRRLFVNALGYWLNATSTDRPFTDLFETIGEGGYPVSPTPISLGARPVTGGHFSLLALEKGRRVFGG